MIWWSCMWLSYLEFWMKTLPQNWHFKDFLIFWWVFWWRWAVNLLAKYLGHLVHFIKFLSLWIFLWVFKFPFLEKHFEHISHLNSSCKCLTSLCNVRRCCEKWPWLDKTLPHISHTNSIFIWVNSKLNRSSWQYSQLIFGFMKSGCLLLYW